MLYSERKNGKKRPDFGTMKRLVYNCIEKILLRKSDILYYEYSAEEIKDFFAVKVGKPDFNISQFDKYVVDDESMFDMIESCLMFLGEKMVESGHYGKYHDDWKYSDFGKFFSDINQVLMNYGFELKMNGEIMKLPDDGMKRLVAENIKTKEPERFEDKIEEAKNIFFSKNGNIETRKSAITLLAKVTEFISKNGGFDGTENNEDIRELHGYVNTTDIRHNKKATRILKEGNTIDENFVDWVFYSLLNCINFYLKSFHKK